MKKVLISGGNSGLGLEITRLLLSKDYHVTILSKDLSKLQKTQTELDSPNLDILQCDLRNYDDIKSQVSTIKDVDILINSAGIIAYQPLEKHDPQNIKDLIDTNVLGTIFLTKELTPIFKNKKSGTIINISSTSGLPTGGHANESVYMASKYAVKGFTEGLKKEMIEEKIPVRVLGFYPGGMNTELFSKAGVDKDTAKFMDPKEVAEIVVFMLERSNSINMDHVVVQRNKVG